MRYERDTAPLREILAEPERPILLAHCCVLTRDAVLGDWADADILIVGDVIVGVGPGLESAADDDGMIVIDCHGCIVAPTGEGRLVPAEPASMTVSRIADPEDAPAGPRVGRPDHTDILLLDGRPVLWGGAPVEGMKQDAPAVRLTLIDVADDDPRIGLWSDERGFLRQRLLPGGRYDEARGDRESAYRGRYWIDGDRIDYLDDLGFWAFGTFSTDRLDHAGYVLSWST